MNTESLRAWKLANLTWYLRIIRHLLPLLFNSEKFTLLSGQYTSLTTKYFERKEFTVKYNLIPVRHREYISSNSPTYRSYVEVRHNPLNSGMAKWLISNSGLWRDPMSFPAVYNRQHFRRRAIHLSNNIVQHLSFSAPACIG